jgi:multiple sugar transport system permease protein
MDLRLQRGQPVGTPRRAPRTRKSSRVRGGFGARHGRLALALLSPTFAILGLVIVYPIIKAFSLAFTETSLLRPNEGQFIGFDNFVRLSQDSEFWQALGTTLVWTIGSVSISYAIGLCLALALNENFPGRRLVRGLVLIPWVTPGVVVGLLFLFILNPTYGFANFVLERLGIIQEFVPWLGTTQTALAAVMLANIWNGVPFYIITLLAGLSSLPEELTEASRIDGASRWQRFRHITFPHLRGVTVVVVSLMTIWNFNGFDLIWTTTQGGPITATTTLSVLVYRTAFDSRDLGYAGAIGVAWMLILLVISFFYIRSMERGQQS